MKSMQLKSCLRLALSAALVLSSLSAARAIAAEAPVAISGFVDGQLQITNSPSLTRGFMVNDGALYITKESEGVDFKIDLPFRQVNAVTGPNFEFATIKAQAYVGYKYANGMRWKLGQFDTSYGLEVNDTVDVVFSRQGNVYNFTDPFVHTGLQLGYDLSKELGVNLLVGSPNDTGALSQTKNPQFGAQVVYTGAVRFSAGGLLNKNAATTETDYYVDGTVGTNVGALSIDAEANYGKRTSEAKQTGMGLLLMPVYALSDTLSVGARGEYITSFARRDPRDPTGPLLDKQWLVFVGPQIAMTKNLKVKVDYSFQRDTDFAGTNDVSHGLQLASVYRF